jgi:serine/threonine protein kinase
VYRARDTRLDRPVALKVLPADKASDVERTTRFIQEAKTASALNHPNIVTIYDVGRDRGVEYLAMELVAGKSLDQAIPRNGLRLGETLRYAVQIADALARAYAAGIVHRDLKPANVMVTADGRPDLGVQCRRLERRAGDASGQRDERHVDYNGSSLMLVENYH